MSFDPRNYRSLVRGALTVAFVGALVLLWVHYGWISVPRGMDAMPEAAPAGSLCLIAKQPDDIPVGAVVFIDVGGGATIVARVVEGDGSRVTVENDNATFRGSFPGRRATFPIENVRGLLLCAFPRDGS